MSPPAVFRVHAPPCLTDSALAGFHDLAYGWRKGEAVSARKWLPFLPFLEAAPPPFRIASLLLIGLATKLHH